MPHAWLKKQNISVMWAVGIERIEEEEISGGAATVPAGTVHVRGKGPAARAMRGAGNAGRGASPTAGKRKGFSF
jgi:hypothetical protein